MPVMDGITALKKIMQETPTPVLMISSATTRGAKATFDAMDAGAVDFLTKDFHKIVEDQERAGREICRKVISVANSSAGKRSGITHREITGHDQTILKRTKFSNYSVLAIGASTGGPVAVQQVLKNLPENFPLPILVIQHMPGTFTPMFSERLNQNCKITVKQAENGDVLQPGQAYIAPGGQQTTVKRQGNVAVLEITVGDPTLQYRPSVDVTYQSLADIFPGKVLALILTGMGSDGCEGARRLKQSGSAVWAQDEATSVVYGMPMAVAKAGLADQILSLDQISDVLARGL